MSAIHYFRINIDSDNNVLSYDTSDAAFAAAAKMAAETNKRVWVREYCAYKNVNGSDPVQIGKSYYVLPDGTFSSKEADRIQELQEEEEALLAEEYVSACSNHW